VTLPRLAVAGPILLALALLAASCGSFASPKGWASPAIDGSNAYVFRQKGKLSALDLSGDTAQVRWTFPDKTKPQQENVSLDAVYGEPVFDADRLFFADWSGRLFAVAKEDGELIWEVRDFDGGIVGGPVLADDVLIFGTTSGRLYAVQKSDGRSPAGSWPPAGVKFGRGIWAPPVVIGETVYVANMSGEVQGFDLGTAAPKWARPFEVSGAIPSLSKLDDRTLFVPTLDKQVYLLDTESGEAEKAPFRASDWIWTDAAVRDGVAYFGDFGGRIYALDITTNQAKWTADVKSKVKAGPAVVEGSRGAVLVLADREPVLHFLDLESGSILNNVPLLDAGTVRAAAAVMEGWALIVTTDGKLFRADASTTTAPDVPVAGG
jgi:outer membrane protein assembly factor BamB